MKPDPQIQALLERAVARVPVDVEQGLAHVRTARAPARRGGIASIAVAAAILLLAVAIVWNNIAADRSFVQGVGREPSGRIAFLHGANFEYELAILDLDTGTETPIAIDGSVTDAAWSPDGTQLAVTVELPNPAGSEIVIVDADGSVRTIMERGHADAVGPDTIAVAWSPDGTKIAFSGRTVGRGRTVSIIDADGSNEQVLDGHWEEVSWSPDGHQLALKGWLDPADEGDFELWTVGVDGTGFTRLTDDARIEFSPVWSPDGDTIAFVTGDQDAPATFDVYVMSPGGTASRLAAHAGFDAMPVWSPDGAWIAFASDRSATASQRAALEAGQSNAGLSVHAVRLDGSEIRLLYRAGNRTEGEAAFPLAWAR